MHRFKRKKWLLSTEWGTQRDLKSEAEARGAKNGGSRGGQGRRGRRGRKDEVGDDTDSSKFLSIQTW